MQLTMSWLLSSHRFVGTLWDGVDRLVDRPLAGRHVGPRSGLRVRRRLDHTYRMTPAFGWKQAAGEHAVGAVVTDALLVPGPGVLLLGDTEVVRLVDARSGSLDDVSEHRASAGSTLPIDLPTVV